MLVPGSANPLLLRTVAAPAAGGISRSLRFNSADSAYLSRTPASAGNRKTWTWAGWVKRSALGAAQEIFAGGAGGTDATQFEIGFASSDILFCWGASTEFLNTTQVFRDVSAWYHIVVSFDTTQATANNRLKLYVNGAEVTTFSTNNRASLTQNGDFGVNQAALHTIGRRASAASWYLNGYLADIYFIDGQALTPSSFTETDATTGQLIPKAFSGSYGSQGWHLEFADNSAATATTLGKDTSGNSPANNWTPNNLSVTAGAGNDSLVDTPTSYGTDTGAGSEVRGNYCTLNPLNTSSIFTLSNGNLNYLTATAANMGSSIGTIGVSSGKWYWEGTLVSARGSFGVARQGAGITVDPGATSLIYYYRFDGNKYNNGGSAYGATYAANDVIGVALDLDAGTLTFYKNGVSQGTAFSSLPSDTYFPQAGDDMTSFTTEGILNFGQRPFAYTAPSGFKALVDTNLPAPVVAKPNTVMDVLTWTGNGAANNRSFTGLAFSPDLVWGKSRSTAYNHRLYDVVRGAGSDKDLASNSTGAEGGGSDDQYGYISSFDSAGFSTTKGTVDNDQWNGLNVAYVAWTWDAGSSTVTNTQGSITSQVRANASAGFSIVKFNTGSSTPFTVGHGLGVKPALIIDKATGAAGSWSVYHSALGATKFLRLNLTNAADTQVYPWNNTEPTSTVFTGGDLGWWGTNFDHICYCFAPVAGHSSFGSYVGNGSADGPFIYTGFRPKFILVKNTSVAGAWEIYDSVRNPYNVMALTLLPNASDAEITASNGVRIDFTSNGFKWRDNGSSINGSGNTIIWAAFAESPFQYARAR